MPWGKKEPSEQGSPLSQEDPDLKRTCHICGEQVSSRVWYGRNLEAGKRKARHTKRVYACPECYFSLDEASRKDYYRERL